MCGYLQMKEDSGRITYNAAFLCSLLGKIHKACLQVKREAYDSSSGSLRQDAVSSVSGDACDFTDEGQEFAWESTTLGLLKAALVTCSAGYDGSISLCNERQLSNHTSDRPQGTG